MKIHHIGYVVKNIDQGILNFESTGYKIEDKLYIDKSRKIFIQFMKNENYRIELISPLEKGSPVDCILKKQGESPYHICYEVEDINKKIEELRKQRYIIVQEPQDAVAIQNKLVAFLFKKGIGLIELVQI